MTFFRLSLLAVLMGGITCAAVAQPSPVPGAKQEAERLNNLPPSHRRQPGISTTPAERRRVWRPIILIGLPTGKWPTDIGWIRIPKWPRARTCL